MYWNKHRKYWTQLHTSVWICTWRGYSFNSPDGLAAIGRTSSELPVLSGTYVDGISITYGTPPNHLWTYVAGLSEDGFYNVNFACPCNTNVNPGTVTPSFVGMQRLLL